MSEIVPNLLRDMRGEWRKEYNERLQDGLLAALEVLQLGKRDHKLAHAGVERETLNGLGNLLYADMESLVLGRSRLIVRQFEALRVAIVVPPEFLEESRNAVNPIGIPRLRKLNRAKEHLVHPEGVGAETLNDHVGVDNVEHRL